MAVVDRRWNSWFLSLKVLLISIGVVSMALMLKVFVPVMLEFAVSGVPGMWSSFRSWLKPPYLYVLINGIIITIVASSRFHQKIHDDNHPAAVPQIPAAVRSEFGYEVKNRTEISPELDYEVKNRTRTEISPEFDYEVKNRSEISPEIGYEVKKEISPEFGYQEKNRTEISPVFYISESLVDDEQNEARVSEVKDQVLNRSEVEDEEFVISRSAWTPPKRMDSSENLSEDLFPVQKPLVSTRFGHRKPLRASPEGGKALRVTRSKRHETLENTWKTLTDGRAMPLTRHLRKSDTFENHGHQITMASQNPTHHHKVSKSETFKDRTNNPPSPLTSSPGLGKLRKEPSLSQDELNRRVEAFIKKFNDEMRLQRQESLNQYMEMINRGAH